MHTLHLLRRQLNAAYTATAALDPRYSDTTGLLAEPIIQSQVSRLDLTPCQAGIGFEPVKLLHKLGLFLTELTERLLLVVYDALKV